MRVHQDGCRAALAQEAEHPVPLQADAHPWVTAAWGASDDVRLGALAGGRRGLLAAAAEKWAAQEPAVQARDAAALPQRKGTKSDASAVAVPSTQGADPSGERSCVDQGSADESELPGQAAWSGRALSVSSQWVPADAAGQPAQGPSTLQERAGAQPKQQEHSAPVRAALEAPEAHRPAGEQSSARQFWAAAQEYSGPEAEQRAA